MQVSLSALILCGNRDHTTCSEETANVARRALSLVGVVAINDQMKGVDIVREQGRQMRAGTVFRLKSSEIGTWMNQHGVKATVSRVQRR